MQLSARARRRIRSGKRAPTSRSRPGFVEAMTPQGQKKYFKRQRMLEERARKMTEVKVTVTPK